MGLVVGQGCGFSL